MMARRWQRLWGIFLLASLALGARPARAQGISFQFAFGGTGSGQLSFPVGVAMSPNGTIVVTDTNNNRIQVFR